jgi:SAM-dependent methyltransferase
MSDDSARAVFAANLANYFSPWSLAEYTREEGLRPLERELVAKFMPPPPAMVLDLGCGAGRTTVGLAETGFRVTAIDLAEPLIVHAKDRHPELDFRVMDATQLTFDRESFDAALFSYNGIDVIFPLRSRLQCLNEVFRILKPGGVFIMSSHNFLGHLFSGGFLYPRGYLNAGRRIAGQVGNRQAFSWYCRFTDPGGAQLLYSAPPSATEAQLAAAGFTVLDVCGPGGERNPRRLRWRQPHVHFVAKKPER